MSPLTRTNSSPNLKSRVTSSSNNSASHKLPSYKDSADSTEEVDDDFYVIGDRVLIDGYKTASVAYFGEVEFALGDWVGVVLDSPTGSHSGKVHGREYFQCAPFQGSFVRPHRVGRLRDSTLGSSASSTPMPSLHFDRNSLLRSSSRAAETKSPGASTLDSYYYDEDYRPDKRPTIEYLTRKLRSIDAKNESYNDNNSNRKPATRSLRDQFFTRTDSLEDDSRRPEIPIRNSSILKTSRPQSSSFSSSSSGDSKFRSHSVTPPSRAQPTITKSLDREPVFNFRPKREQLNERSRVLRYTNEGDSNTSNMSYGHYRSATPSIVGRASVDLSSEPPRKGDRVTVRTERGEMTGILRFMGETEFATGEWAGVELDRAQGKNDGSILGVRYFYCPNDYGLFVPATRVKKYRPLSANSGASPVMPEIFNSIRSTITSPPPAPSRSIYNRAGSTSTTPYGSSNYLPDSSPLQRSLSSACSSNSLYNNNDHRFKTKTATSKLTDSNNYGGSASSTSLFSRPSSSSSSPNLDAYKFKTSLRERDDYRPSKFSEADIEYQLRETLNRSSNLLNSTNLNNKGYQTNWSSPSYSSRQPKSIKYTFSASKYDGNPIARRTVEYHN